MFQTVAEKQQAQQQLAMQAQAAQQAQQAQAGPTGMSGPGGAPGGPPPGASPPPQPMPQPSPDMMEMLQRPTWEEVCGLLRDNTLRGFRIDVETDSTIEPNDQEEKQRRMEFVTTIGEYIAKSIPAMQLVPQMTPVITQGLLFLVRGFRVGREMEETIEEALGKLREPAADPAAAAGPAAEARRVPQAQMARAQADTIKAQATMLDAQTNRLKAVGDLQIENKKIGAEDQRTNLDRQADMHMHGQDIASDLHQAVVKGVERRMVRDMNSERPMEAPTR